MTQSQHVASEASLLRSLLLPVALLLYPVINPQQFGLQQSGQGSDGIFFNVALVSLPASH
jgi:hypothetical protein